MKQQSLNQAENALRKFKNKLGFLNQMKGCAKTFEEKVREKKTLLNFYKDIKLRLYFTSRREM